MNLSEKIMEAQSRLELLQRLASMATCEEMGHRMVHLGGVNCGCFKDACCSIPVHTCSRCGDCDYGDNIEAKATKAACFELNPDPHIDAALIEAGIWI